VRIMSSYSGFVFKTLDRKVILDLERPIFLRLHFSDCNSRDVKIILPSSRTRSRIKTAYLGQSAGPSQSTSGPEQWDTRPYKDCSNEFEYDTKRMYINHRAIFQADSKTPQLAGSLLEAVGKLLGCLKTLAKAGNVSSKPKRRLCLITSEPDRLCFRYSSLNT
jgi:hypothetical protein